MKNNKKLLTLILVTLIAAAPVQSQAGIFWSWFNRQDFELKASLSLMVIGAIGIMGNNIFKWYWKKPTKTAVKKTVEKKTDTTKINLNQKTVQNIPAITDLGQEHIDAIREYRQKLKQKKPEKTPGNPDDVIKTAGLYNKGNNCYLNSLAQALFHTPTFINNIDSKKNQEQIVSKNQDDSLLSTLYELVQEIQFNGLGIIDAKKYHDIVKKALGFVKKNGDKKASYSKQQDASEALGEIITQIKRNLKTTNKNLFTISH